MGGGDLPWLLRRIEKLGFEHPPALLAADNCAIAMRSRARAHTQE